MKFFLLLLFAVAVAFAPRPLSSGPSALACADTARAGPPPAGVPEPDSVQAPLERNLYRLQFPLLGLPRASRPRERAKPEAAPPIKRHTSDPGRAREEKRLSFGLRLGFDFFSGRQDYAMDRLRRFGLEDKGWGFGGYFSGYVTGRGYCVELEAGLDADDGGELFESRTNWVDFESSNLGLWLRRDYHDVLGFLGTHAPRIDFFPGVSVAYVNAQVRMGATEGESGWDTVLYGDGFGLAVGAAAQWSIFFIDYRYRWWRIRDAEPARGCDFFFPGEPEIDFSGHFLAIGFGGDNHVPNLPWGSHE